MPDRYDTVRNDTFKSLGKWKLTRTDEEPEFGFVKDVGFFDLKSEAKRALEQIKDHENMNFAEWFYVQRLFYKNDTLDQGIIAKHLYKLWRAIGGHLTVDAKRDVMMQQAVMLTYVMHEYEEKIEDIEMAHAQQQAGASW